MTSPLSILCLKKLAKDGKSPFPFFTTEDLLQFQEIHSQSQEEGRKKKRKVEKEGRNTNQSQERKIQKLLEELIKKNHIASRSFPISKSSSVVIHKVLEERKERANRSPPPDQIKKDFDRTHAPFSTPKKDPLHKPFVSPLRVSGNLKSPLARPSFRSPTPGKSSGTLNNRELTELNVKKRALTNRIDELENLIRKEKIIQNCSKNGELPKLRRLSEKWLNVCQTATEELQKKAPQPIPKKDILMAMQVNPELLGLNEEEDDFA